MSKVEVADPAVQTRKLTRLDELSLDNTKLLDPNVSFYIAFYLRSKMLGGYTLFESTYAFYVSIFILLTFI